MGKSRPVEAVMDNQTISVDEPRGAAVELKAEVPNGWALHKWYEKTYVPSEYVSRPPNDGRLDFKAQAMVFANVGDAIADFKARLPCEGGYVEVLEEGELPQGGMYTAVKVLYPEGSSSLNHNSLSCTSIVHKPTMSYVITTTATAPMNAMKSNTWELLVNACKQTDLAHELPKSEFGDLDF